MYRIFKRCVLDDINLFSSDKPHFDNALAECSACLGSNTDCEANLKSAVSLLRAYFGSIRFSEAIYTEPIGLSDSGLFLNQVAVAGTNASLEEVRRAVKAMEKRLGRMSDSKQKGKIPIDIDLLLWNGTILKPADWEKEYVQLLFRSVAD